MTYIAAGLSRAIENGVFMRRRQWIHCSDAVTAQFNNVGVGSVLSYGLDDSLKEGRRDVGGGTAHYREAGKLKSISLSSTLLRATLHRPTLYALR